VIAVNYPASSLCHSLVPHISYWESKKLKVKIKNTVSFDFLIFIFELLLIEKIDWINLKK
jgi:hypothetical protein